MPTFFVLSKVNGRVGRMMDVVVLKKHRRHGLARGMVSLVKKIACKQKLDYIEVCPREFRISGMCLYESEDFRRQNNLAVYRYSIKP